MNIVDERLLYENLCDELWEHNRKYYVEHMPKISDYEYDQLMNRLYELETLHPEWITASSPTQRVGEALTGGFKTVEHRTPMLSLPNTYSKEEVNTFIERILRVTGKEKMAFSVELKMDGIAVSVWYEQGALVKALTRGNGFKGDDITANVRTILSVPLKLSVDQPPAFLEVRGEVFMSREVFNNLNEQRLANGEEAWANPRNAAAGSLKLLNPEEASKRHLSIAFYAMVENSQTDVNSQYTVHARLKKFGLPTLLEVKLCHNVDEIWEFVEYIRNIRCQLPFDIDGLVIKVDDLKDQERLGVTGKAPRWAVAYKFAPEQARTHIKAITVQVGRTGVLTPVAELEPVFLMGSTISRATLHNEEDVFRKDIRVGDIAVVEKGGDVIPKVVAVDSLDRDKNSISWHMPEHCPCCGTIVERKPDEVAIRCPNKNCPERCLRAIVFFASKQAMNIEHLGEKVVEQLFNKEFIKEPADIYRLDEKKCSQLDGFKEKSIRNLLDSIERSKVVSLPRFIMALGIKYVGIGTAEILAEHAGSIETLMAFSQEALLQIDGVGIKVAQAILDFFGDDNNVGEVRKLLEYGVRPQVVETKVKLDNPLYGKTLVITGALQHFTRQGAADAAKKCGAKVTSTVSKKTDFVVVGQDPGSKYEHAQQLNIAILDEITFIKLLGISFQNS